MRFLRCWDLKARKNDDLMFCEKSSDRIDRIDISMIGKSDDLNVVLDSNVQQLLIIFRFR